MSNKNNVILLELSNERKELDFQKATQSNDGQSDDIKNESERNVISARKGDRVGEGGFGKVYKVYIGDKKYALKVLLEFDHNQIAQDKEALILREISHANIRGISGVYPLAKKNLILLEFCDGGNLFNFIHTNEIVSQTVLFKWIMDVAKALDYLHGLNPAIVHRDVKIENILLKQKPCMCYQFLDVKLLYKSGNDLCRNCRQYRLDKITVKLSDFGLATTLDLDRCDNGPLAGTYRCMSPEYALNKIVSTKLDVWSYGILVWEMFSRKTAPKPHFFDECWKNRLEFATEIEFPRILKETFNKCWEFNFEKRPNIGEILHAVESYYRNRNENSSSSQSKEKVEDTQKNPHQEDVEINESSVQIKKENSLLILSTRMKQRVVSCYNSLVDFSRRQPSSHDHIPEGYQSH